MSFTDQMRALGVTSPLTRLAQRGGTRDDGTVYMIGWAHEIQFIDDAYRVLVLRAGKPHKAREAHIAAVRAGAPGFMVMALEKTGGKPENGRIAHLNTARLWPVCSFAEAENGDLYALLGHTGKAGIIDVPGFAWRDNDE